MILKFKKIKGKYYTFHIAVKLDVINIYASKNLLLISLKKNNVLQK